MGRNPPTRPECHRSLPKGTVTRDTGCTPATRVAAPPPCRRAGDGGASPQRNEGVTSQVRMDRISVWRRGGEGGGLASPSQEEATERRRIRCGSVTLIYGATQTMTRSRRRVVVGNDGDGQ
jgi:hypothetical protein